MLADVTQLTIGQLAERAGVATSAIRFYEARGLIHSVRTTGNQRRYEQSTLRRVAFIRTAQRVGLTLEEIGEALATLPENRTPTKADWPGSAGPGGPGSTSRSARIELLRDQLDGCIGCGCLSLQDLRAEQPRRRRRRARPRRRLLEPRAPVVPR